MHYMNALINNVISNSKISNKEIVWKLQITTNFNLKKASNDFNLVELQINCVQINHAC